MKDRLMRRRRNPINPKYKRTVTESAFCRLFDKIYSWGQPPISDNDLKELDRLALIVNKEAEIRAGISEVK